MQPAPAPEGGSAAYEALIQFLYQAPIGLVQARLDGEIVMINPMSARLLMPLAPDGNLVNLFDVLAIAAPQLPALVAQPAEPGAVICEALHVHLPGTAGIVSTSTLSIRLLRLDETTLMASVSDVTHTLRQEQQRLASRLRDATRLDPLTQLPNRAVVLECIEAALRRSRAEPEHEFAVLFINIDRFDRVNLTLGPAAGDDLLRQLAGRLHAVVRLRDTVGRATAPTQTAARLGGDEFVVVLEGLRSADDVDGVAQRLVDALCMAYQVGDQSVHSSVSVGVVSRDHAAADADAVLQDASLAMREAKRAGGGRYCTFASSMKERAWRRGSLESELRDALDLGQLFLVYQPIVQLSGEASGDVAGVEALVRWRHPLRGIVPPVEFIEIAEETGLIVPLGQHVLRMACLQLAAWRRDLGPRAPQVMSVNVSRAQLLEPAIVGHVRDALEASGLGGTVLQLEVTESLAAQDERLQERLRELKGLGVTLALDDFGTGYSSLASLHQMPIDVLKIDRSFVRQVESSAHHRVLIEATVQVARSLGMSTVAEGVETPEQAALLAAMHCDKSQGYLHARPLPAEEATRWLAAREAPSTRPAPATRSPSHAAPLLADRLLESMESVPVAIGLFDPRERLAWANRAFRDIHCRGLGEDPTWEEIMRAAHRERRGVLIETPDIEAWLADVRRRFRRQTLRSFESDLCDGRWMRVIEETAADGWTISVSTEVTSLKVNESELRRARDAALVASITDPLTGLPNRRHVFERLRLLIEESRELRIPLTVAVIDLDEFKSINDRHGHAGGDQILIAFSRRLAARIRPRDALGRIGGEEFLLVLANTGREGAERVLQDVRSAMQDDPAMQPWPQTRIGFSAGIAQLQPEDDLDSVWQRADQGLYRAKAAGRGRDCFVAAPARPVAAPALIGAPTADDVRG